MRRGGRAAGGRCGAMRRRSRTLEARFSGGMERAGELAAGRSLCADRIFLVRIFLGRKPFEYRLRVFIDTNRLFWRFK